MSIKKFGTPIAAGPGSANENVGFDAEGVPSGRRGGGGAGGPEVAGWLLLVLLPLPAPMPDLPLEPEFEPGCWDWVCEVDVGWFD